MNNGSSFSLQITNIDFFDEFIKFFSQKMHFSSFITPFFGNKTHSQQINLSTLLICCIFVTVFYNTTYFKNLISFQFNKL